MALSSSATKAESRIKEILEVNQSSRVGIFSMEDVSGDEDDDAEFSPIPLLYNPDCHNEVAKNSPIVNWYQTYPLRIFLQSGLILRTACLLMHYRSGGLGINPNLNKSGEVRLSLPKTSGGREDMWYFEDFVVGYFRDHVHDILMSCKKVSHSITFKNDLASCINLLIDAYRKIRAKEAEDFKVERVSESSFMHENDIMHENKNTPYEEELYYDDPFKIYDILNMNKDNVGKSLDEGFKYPLGFTPVDEDRDKREAQIINEPEVQNVILNKNNETWSTSGIFSARSKDSRFLKYKLEVLF
ncbi:hypothetical protein Tco_0814845 [Tanacetum coccineum]